MGKISGIFTVLLVSFVALCSCSDTGLDGKNPSNPGDTQEELSILFIGNSFTMDAVTHLPGILAAAGIKKVHMVHMYYGGRVISQYESGWTTSSDYKMYECRPGATAWTVTDNTNLSEVAAGQKWDIVTIQEHTGNKAAWTWSTTAQNNLQSLIDKVKAAQGDNVPKFYYILSQAYSDMSKIGQSSQSSVSWGSSQSGMWDVIASFGRKVMENLPFDGIISTGVMLQNLRTSSVNNSMDLTRDGYHMDNGLARYGASCAVFETLITPKYNKKLDGNTYTYDVSNTTTTPVTSTNAPIARDAARYAIRSPYVVTQMKN